MNIDIKIFPSVENNSYKLISGDLNIKYHKVRAHFEKISNRYNSFFDFRYDGNGLILSFDYGDNPFKSGYITHDFLRNHFDGLRFASLGTSNPPFDNNDARYAQQIGVFISSKFQCYVEARAFYDYFHHKDFAYYCGCNHNLGHIPQDCIENNFDVCNAYLQKILNQLNLLWSAVHF